MSKLIVSISGLRGIVGDGLEPDYLTRFAAALGSMCGGGTVVVSRDGRASGLMLRHAALAGLTATGCRVVDAGIASTPTCGVLVSHLQADAGLQMTASHNPVEWNGLKPFSRAGAVLNQDEGRRLLEILEAGRFRYTAWDGLGRVDRLDDSIGPHLQRIVPLIDVAAVRKRRFKVVLDCNHGSGAVFGPRLLDELGCEVHLLGGQPDGRFEHAPEPLAEHLGGLCQAVRQHEADAGFAQDPDADRLAVVDNTGRYLGEELTLALCADHVLARRPGAVVVNNSTSRVTADLAEKHGCEFHRAPVGEAHVVARMKQVGAVLGGEGNGGVIEPRVGYVRDSFVAMAYVLEGLASTGRTLADWASSLPQYKIVKDKLACRPDRIEAACAALKAANRDAVPEEGDGLRLNWDDRWVQVRASNTEPVVRVIAEAPSEQTARALCRAAVRTVRGAAGTG